MFRVSRLDRTIQLLRGSNSCVRGEFPGGLDSEIPTSRIPSLWTDRVIPQDPPEATLKRPPTTAILQNHHLHKPP